MDNVLKELEQNEIKASYIYHLNKLVTVNFINSYRYMITFVKYRDVAPFTSTESFIITSASKFNDIFERVRNTKISDSFKEDERINKYILIDGCMTNFGISNFYVNTLADFGVYKFNLLHPFDTEYLSEEFLDLINDTKHFMGKYDAVLFKVDNALNPDKTFMVPIKISKECETNRRFLVDIFSDKIFENPQKITESSRYLRVLIIPVYIPSPVTICAEDKLIEKLTSYKFGLFQSISTSFTDVRSMIVNIFTN